MNLIKISHTLPYAITNKIEKDDFIYALLHVDGENRSCG